QRGRQPRNCISSASGHAVMDPDMAMLDIATPAKAAPDRRNEVRELAGRFQAENPDHRHRRLLRARRRWPSRRTAAEKRDKFPPPHGAYPKAKDRGLSIAGSWSAFRGRASQQKRPAHVRYGSGADITRSLSNVRFPLLFTLRALQPSTGQTQEAPH